MKYLKKYLDECGHLSSLLDWLVSVWMPVSVELWGEPTLVSELEVVEVCEGMEEVGEASSTEYCRSEMEAGRGRSRPDFCRVNRDSLYEAQSPSSSKTFRTFGLQYSSGGDV